MSENVQGTFISQKISKIRWKREEFAEMKSFLTGSWDDPVNKITHWSLTTNDDDETYPVVVSEYSFLGDVTEIKFINSSFFVASSSLGSIRLLQIQENPVPQFKEHMAWEFIHSFKTLDYAPCTALSNFEQDIVSVGEDGRINLLTTTQKKPVRVIENGDSCSIYCVDFLRHSEILTGNMRGHMKVWDLRNDQDIPATTFMLSDETTTEAMSIAHHPTQRQIIVAGGGDGSLTVWDLRHHTYPISQLNAHARAVRRIMFHPDRPENVFTCSNSGELWHWNNSQQSKLRLGHFRDISLPIHFLIYVYICHIYVVIFILDSTDTHWLNTIGTNSNINVTSLCCVMHKPINSIDIDKSSLLFGCDNEAMYIVKNVAI
ncbi:nucleoporin Nup43 isoform X2 [Polistes fuscatus]|uniref:nucleoporin Nup43 isoform X2 n=1 Tax=Polistes fuscatus TaxID=30207 RepID=UPI001CAA2962|nr:nucleoporin Nup43 isoform X2 [Polistes fuscatus]